MKVFSTVYSGIIKNNPVFVLLLGMCPSLAVTTSVVNALGMGASACAVLVMSNVIISALRRLIPEKIRIASFIVIIAGLVTIIEMLLKAYAPAIAASLGIFIPLIVVNCIILARAEAFASRENVWLSAVDGVSVGLGFTLALCVIAAIREVLGAGSFLGNPLFGGVAPLPIFILPAGGFLTMGVVLALIAQVRIKIRGQK